MNLTPLTRFDDAAVIRGLAKLRNRQCHHEPLSKCDRPHGHDKINAQMLDGIELSNRDFMANIPNDSRTDRKLR